MYREFCCGNLKETDYLENLRVDEVNIKMDPE
jgi:hypothetical protein